jgi:hypothetical protein
MGIGVEYLGVVRDRFGALKHLAEGALLQVTDAQLGWAPNAESNSIAIIVKHLSGNMIARWTDFFTSDGEKPDRQRDAEFSAGVMTRAEMMAIWAQGWDRFNATLEAFTPADLLRVVTIRGEPHSVIAAIERQMSHYGYHVGQIVYIAKLLNDDNWQTLSIPRHR